MSFPVARSRGSAGGRLAHAGRRCVRCECGGGHAYLWAPYLSSWSMNACADDLRMSRNVVTGRRVSQQQTPPRMGRRARVCGCRLRGSQFCRQDASEGDGARELRLSRQVHLRRQQRIKRARDRPGRSARAESARAGNTCRARRGHCRAHTVGDSRHGFGIGLGLVACWFLGCVKGKPKDLRVCRASCALLYEAWGHFSPSV